MLQRQPLAHSAYAAASLLPTATNPVALLTYWRSRNPPYSTWQLNDVDELWLKKGTVWRTALALCTQHESSCPDYYLNNKIVCVNKLKVG